MIAKPFYLLKKIIFTTKFTNKSKEKILFTNKSQTIKSHFLEKILFTTSQKQPKLKPLFLSLPLFKQPHFF
ncbi:hypothetical protein C2R71_07050 [Helicobacter pylori]|nr:hypothetical protein C2R71_07050 [Helicobacter pylori]